MGNRWRDLIKLEREREAGRTGGPQRVVYLGVAMIPLWQGLTADS